MDMEELNSFIRTHSGEFQSTGPVLDEEVRAAEAALGYEFAPALKDVLRQYGALAFRSLEFFGLGVRPGSHLNVVGRTEELRSEAGFPEGGVVIEDLDDAHFAVVLPAGSVVEWAIPHHLGQMRPLESGVAEYLLGRLSAVAEGDPA